MIWSAAGKALSAKGIAGIGNCDVPRYARGDKVSDEPLITVVTPFHNTELYLRECIESVLAQTYGNWEYILVDNCSTDQSAAIAEEYAERLPQQVRLIRNSAFLAQVENYNVALAAIGDSSQYCKMVQADDWIFPDCLARMSEVAVAHPLAGIVAAYELEGDEVRLDGLPYPSWEISGREAGRRYFLDGKYLFGSPTSLLMRSDIVRSRRPFYDERYAPFEDGHACLDILRDCNFGFVHQVLTYTRRDNASIIARVRPFGMELFVRYSLLVAHGRDYLSEPEYDACFRRAERDYFVFLCKSAMSIRPCPPGFWSFHREGLAAIGRPLERQQIGRRIPRALLEKMWGTFWRWRDRDDNLSGEPPAVSPAPALPRSTVGGGVRGSTPLDRPIYKRDGQSRPLGNTER